MTYILSLFALLTNLSTGAELDMGTTFDFFGPESHHEHDKLSKAQSQNRKKLRHLMEKHGFTAYEKEWWHCT